MLLLGLSLGRKMENTEILVKEALSSAKESGAEVRFIRLLDLDIKPCKGCTACAESLFMGGPGLCNIKDDLHLLDEQMMQCDGVILGSPVFVLGPHGLLKTITDRFGPSHDVAFRQEATKRARAQGKQAPDQRAFKPRVAGFISVGGAATPHWLSFGLPLMNLFTFPSHITVVDQMQVNSRSRGSVVMEPDIIKRAAKLGRNVAKYLGMPREKVKWMGDEKGTCPVCHSNLLTVTNKNPVECPICGISGKLTTEGNKIKVTFSQKEKARSRLEIAGKLEHWIELGELLPLMMHQDPKELANRKAKYKGFAEFNIKG